MTVEQAKDAMRRLPPPYKVTGRTVALPFLPASFTTDPSANSRLRREAQAASACDRTDFSIYQVKGRRPFRIVPSD